MSNPEVAHGHGRRATGELTLLGANYWAVGFRIDYVRVDGDLADNVPDCLVRADECTGYVIELKAGRSATWNARWNPTAASRAARGPDYRFVFVDQAGFERHRPKDFPRLVNIFRESQD